MWQGNSPHTKAYVTKILPPLCVSAHTTPYRKVVCETQTRAKIIGCYPENHIPFRFIKSYIKICPKATILKQRGMPSCQNTYEIIDRKGIKELYKNTDWSQNQSKA